MTLGGDINSVPKHSELPHRQIPRQKPSF